MKQSMDGDCFPAIVLPLQNLGVDVELSLGLVPDIVQDAKNGSGANVKW